MDTILRTSSIQWERTLDAQLLLSIPVMPVFRRTWNRCATSLNWAFTCSIMICYIACVVWLYVHGCSVSLEFWENVSSEDIKFSLVHLTLHPIFHSTHSAFKNAPMHTRWAWVHTAVVTAAVVAPLLHRLTVRKYFTNKYCCMYNIYQRSTCIQHPIISTISSECVCAAASLLHRPSFLFHTHSLLADILKFTRTQLSTRI